MPEKTKDEFADGGWFRTGDVGKVDARGYVTIVGRSKDLIISGGFNVYPAEVEAALNDLPGVAESAVVGVPHSDFGEAVVAVVVAKPGVALDGDALVAALKEKMANFKVPKALFVASELPRNAMGKVQKNLLRDQHQGLFVGLGDGHEASRQVAAGVGRPRSEVEEEPSAKLAGCSAGDMSGGGRPMPAAGGIQITAQRKTSDCTIRPWPSTRSPSRSCRTA
jgi:hypothetical protein